MQFQHVYDELKNEHEIGIAEKYYYAARRYTSILTSKIVIFINIIYLIIYFFLIYTLQIYL